MEPTAQPATRAASAISTKSSIVLQAHASWISFSRAALLTVLTQARWQLTLAQACLTTTRAPLDDAVLMVAPGRPVSRARPTRASAPRTVTVTARTDSMTGPSSPAVTQSSPSSSNTSTPGITTASASATPGQTVPSAGANQPLGLADAQAKVGEWEESRYEIADRSDVRGIGVPVTYCGDSGMSTAMLEYRLANRFKTLSMSISQANSSKQSDQQLTVAVIANGSQLDIQTVPFNQVKPVQLPVLGVNALQIRLFLNEKVKDCGNGGVTGVIEQLVVS